MAALGASMRHTVRVLFAFMLWTATASSAAADKLSFETGDDLWARCSGNDSYRLLCLGYVVGVADAMSAQPASGQQGGISGFQACIPAGTHEKQLADPVRLYLQNHPEQRHYEAADLVAAVLSLTFPCSQ